MVFNSRTGTVVMGDGVALHAAAVSHGSLTVSINENQQRVKPAGMPCGRARSGNAAEQYRGESCAFRRVEFAESSSLKTLVNALNSGARDAGRHYVDFAGAA